ncbi:undecaprenyl-phosphate glucose phosphotransferase [Parapedobacter koreensis]|uniref:Putative colanic acid biosysnthesis UDP-glucose lipid carrier transferase n=1 Tax=Parapedobacter koreensis TaxID=332977 RepID=A0A1H7NQZ7_9SPHI|nr:undecaprenyl-phosphate glucose phosphotransferase [Parapedobacter koreensis]SEL25754.1 putative colanic acid biosysnthesis UDP-glucose lipid carrier transferase [Parapedobacter koreensis]
MQTRYIYLLKFVLAFSDFLLLNGAFVVASMLAEQHYFLNESVVFRFYLPIANLLWLFSSGLFSLYGNGTVVSLDKIYRATWRSIGIHASLFTLYLIIADTGATHTAFFLTVFHLSFLLLLVISRLVGTFFQGMLIQHFHIRKTVAIMGKNDGGRQLARYFRAHEKLFHFEGYLAESDAQLVNDRGEVMPAARKQFARAVAMGIQEVYVSLPPHRIAQAATLLEEAERLCLRVKLVPDLKRQDSLPYEISLLGPVPVVSIRHEPAYEIEGRSKKRIFDLLFSTLVILFILSWLYTLIGLLIKLESPGPVLFKQQRSGRDNKPFWCYKFRSMRVNAESDSKQATPGDNRITRIGAFLRRTSLDELPQFFNVWLGHMSVVGPRPHMLRHTEEYSALIDKYMLRQFLKPGITGWAQVNGYRGETTNPQLMERRVAHDIWYLENWTTMLDVRIVFLTVINLLVGEENAH